MRDDFFHLVEICVGDIGRAVKIINQILSRLDGAREIKDAVGRAKFQLTDAALAYHFDAEGKTAFERSAPLPIVVFEVAKIASRNILRIKEIA